MIRQSALILLVSLTLGAAAPVLCDLACLAHAGPRQARPCHDEAPGSRLSAGSEACVHGLADVTAVIAAVKIDPAQDLAAAVLVGTSLTLSAPSLKGDHASGPLGDTVQPRTVLRTVLRI